MLKVAADGAVREDLAASMDEIVRETAASRLRPGPMGSRGLRRGGLGVGRIREHRHTPRSRSECTKSATQGPVFDRQQGRPRRKVDSRERC
jgi:hypothetical protein